MYIPAYAREKSVVSSVDVADRSKGCTVAGFGVHGLASYSMPGGSGFIDV
jgi:hypothetical protein